MTGTPVVIAVGNPWAHDDGVGATVAASFGPADLPGVALVVLDGEPARLVEAWAGAPLAVVVDAARTGAPPGTVHRLDGHPGDGLDASGPATSSHALGVADAWALGLALDRLPTRLVVVAVEGEDFSPGPGLSPAVAAAVPVARAAVRRALGRSGYSDST